MHFNMIYVVVFGSGCCCLWLEGWKTV